MDLFKILHAQNIINSRNNANSRLLSPEAKALCPHAVYAWRYAHSHHTFSFRNTNFCVKSPEAALFVSPSEHVEDTTKHVKTGIIC